MEYTHYAAIDIGSNAVRMLIKRVNNATTGSMSKIVHLRIPLRLGQEAFTIGEISEHKAFELKEVLRSYAIIMKLYGVKKKNFRACATAAMREAKNGEKIAAEISKRLDMEIEVIAGTEEAAIVCQAHTGGDTNRDLVYVDVGGGSTEISLISNGEMVSTTSYKIGTVRILNGAYDNDVKEQMVRDLELMAIDHPKLTIVGAGGNINKLFEIALEREAEGQSFKTEMLHSLYDDLRSVSIEERIEKFKLKPDRADVIVPAAEIFLTIAHALNATEIEVPSTGLVDGIIDGIFIQNQNKAARSGRKKTQFLK
ncbi:MAG: Ppx/GppA family phosphatase [Bacteroidales bacterium]|nr:Ppx/GppA family phosphatase [Bacteroidales bacterium]